MKILLLAAAALFIQLFIFLCAGSVVMRVRGRDEYSLCGASLLGFFVYFGVFEVICLVCEVTLVPLTVLSYITAGVSVLFAAAGIVWGHKCWLASLRSLRGRLKHHGAILIPVLIVLAATLLYVLLYYDASADSGWYVGTSSTALATDTIGRFDPSTGTMTQTFMARYALNCFPYHSAVVCVLIRGLPVIVQARSVMSVIDVLMSFTAVYYLGRALFGALPDGAYIRDGGNSLEASSRRRADLFVLAVCLVNLFSSTIYMPGVFLYTRSFEGKSLIVNVVLVSALCVCASLWREEGEECAFRDLFWIAAAGVCFSASSIMVTVLTFSAIVPLIALRGRWKMTAALILGNLPVIVWAVTYYLIQHGAIVLRTWR